MWSGTSDLVQRQNISVLNDNISQGGSLSWPITERANDDDGTWCMGDCWGCWYGDYNPLHHIRTHSDRLRTFRVFWIILCIICLTALCIRRLTRQHSNIIIIISGIIVIWNNICRSFWYDILATKMSINKNRIKMRFVSLQMYEDIFLACIFFVF